MKKFKTTFLISILITLIGCTEDNEPTRTYWEKDIHNLFEINNNEFYAIYKKKLDIHEIVDPENLEHTDTQLYDENLTSFVINNNLIFSSDQNNNFYLSDITDPRFPSNVEDLNIYRYNSYTLQNNHLYTTTSSYSDYTTSYYLNIIDLTVIDTPNFRQNISIDRPISMASQAGNLFVCTSIPIVTSTNDSTNNYTKTIYVERLRVYDITDSSNISTIELDEDINCGSLKIQENTLIDISKGKISQYDVSELPPVLLSIIDRNNII